MSIIRYILPCAALTLCACSSLSSEQSRLPKPELTTIHINATNKSNPIVNIPFCITNNLEEDVPLKELEVALVMNDVLLKQAKFKAPIEELEPKSTFCKHVNIKLDAINDSRVSSIVLNSIFSKKYKVSMWLYFDDKHTQPTVTTIEGETN